MKKFLCVILLSILLVIPSVVRAEDMLSFGGSTPTSKELYVGSIVPEYDTTQDIAIKAATGEYDFAALLSNINQSLKYKVNIVNNTTNDYIVDSVSLRDSSKNFLKFSYGGIEKHNLIKAGTSKEVYLQIDTVDYVEKGVSEDYKLDINYSVNGSILNPKTGVYSYLVASLIVMALFVIGIKGINSNSKFKTVCFILIPVIFIGLTNTITAKDENVLTINGNISFKDLVNLLHLSIDPNEGLYNNSGEVFKANVEKDTVIDLSGVERDNYFFNYWIYNDLTSVVKTDSYKVEQDSDFVADWLYDSCSKVETVSDPNPGQFRGEGIKDNPYLIESVEDLTHLAVIVNDGTETGHIYYKLDNDLDFKCAKSYVNSETVSFGDINGDGETSGLLQELTTEAGWPMIGKSSNGTRTFNSYIDGNNKTIYNMYINNKDGDAAGFIGRANYNGINNEKIIYNLSLKGIDITSNGFATGGLIGNFYVDTGYSAIIENIYTDGNISCSGNCGGNVGYVSSYDLEGNHWVNKANIKATSSYVAGNIGSFYNYLQNNSHSKLSYLYNYGFVNTTNSYKSGNVAYMSYATVDHIYNYGNIYEKNNSGYVGGNFAYLAYSDASYVYNYGNVTGSSGYVGGNSGQIKYRTAHDFYNFGTVKVVKDDATGYCNGQVGGISGAMQEYANITNAVNNGDIITNVAQYVGGISGYTYVYFDNVVNNGNITVNEDCMSSYYVGGLIGMPANSTMFHLNNGYNTGNITVNNNVNSTYSPVGAIFGYKGTENVSNVYSVGDITVNSDKEIYSGLVAGSTSNNLKNVFVKANYYGTGSTSLFASYFSGDNLDNIYVNVNTDIDKLYTARQVTTESYYSGLTNMYYDIHNFKGEKVLTGASAFDSSKINSTWFRDTLKLGNTWKYEDGKYPKLYALDEAGNVTNKLIDYQKDIDL